MSERFPKDGKMFVAEPAIAAAFAEHDPIFGMRVFTHPSIPSGKVFILDIDALNEELGFGRAAVGADSE